MQTQFVYIDDISKIDSSKATVYDLNKRYIDSEGNMYGLKYNRESKKIEVIRLLRTSIQHAQMVAKRMQEKMKADLPKLSRDEEVISNTVHPDTPESFEEIEKEYSKSSKIVPDIFVTERFNDLPVFKERLKGLLRNIANSNINSREHREISTPLDEVIRNIEIDGLGKIEKITSSYRELTEYPRSINYYIGRLDNRAREILNNISSDSKKIKFILWMEMLHSLKEFYQSVGKMLIALERKLDKTAEERLSKIGALERQSYHDARTTITNTKSDIEDMSRKLNEFELFIYSQDNVC
ncbi:MAG: hypothetical protein KA015_05510 [Spirochaetes bacterium]|nr:hypothetical protein [Spirochaetota bacterium]